MWTNEIIWDRYVEAFDTLRRLPPEPRRGLKSNWPMIVRDFGDAIAAEEQRAFEAYPFPKGWNRPAPPSPQRITRMEQVWAWHADYLADQEPLALLMVACAHFTAIGKPVSKVFRARYLSTRTGWRRLAEAKDRVRRGLIRDRINAGEISAAVA